MQSLPPPVPPEPPLLDPAIYAQTAAYLPPGAMDRYLDTLTGLGTSLRTGLQALDPAAHAGALEQLADLAHAMAGSAGLFGYQRAATLARLFERDVQTGSAEWLARAGDLAHALDATLADIAARRA